jgi:hypothetical protein
MATVNPVLYDMVRQTASPTPTLRLCGTALIRNDGFETGHFTGGWFIDNADPYLVRGPDHPRQVPG